MSQTVIDFETAGDGYTPSATEGSGDTDVFNRSNPNIGGNSTFIWAVEDLTLPDPNIELDVIDVTGSSSFTFSIDMLTPNTEDWDVTDELLITYSLDGGAYQNLMWVQSNDDGDPHNAPAALDLDFDGTGDDGEELPAIADDFGAGVGSNFETFTTSSISLSGNSTIDIKLQFNGLTSAAEGIYLDNITITEVAGATPTLAVSPASLSGLDYVVGAGPSAEQTFVLSGTNLNNSNVTLNAPADFEISKTSGGPFSTGLTYSSYNGSNQTVYVRLKSGKGINTYSGNISIAGGGDTDGESVALSGDVTAMPTIVLDDADNTQVTAGDVPQNTSNHIIGNFEIDVSDADATLIAANVLMDGTYINTDISGNEFQLWYNSANNFGAATAIDAQTASGSGGSGEIISFSGFSQSITDGSTGYFWITADIDASANVGNTIQLTSINNTDLSFSVGVNRSGSTSDAGTQTIIAYVGPCGEETFTNSNLTSSYTTNSFTGDNSVTWSYVASRDESTYGITGKGIMLRRSSDNSKVTSSSVSGGIGDFTCKLRKAFTGSGNRQVELFVNGVSKGTSLAWDNTNVQTFTVSGINISGNVIIEIRNITGKQVIVDDIEWSCYDSCVEPTTQASLFSATDIGTTSMTINYTRGDGDAVLVLAKAGSAVDADPTSGTAYTANTIFGSGDEIGTGNFVVYSGTADNFALTGLDSYTDYHFAFYEYNSVDDCYLLTSPLTGNASTLCATPATHASNAVFSLITGTSMTITWTNGDGANRIVLVREEGSVNTSPTDNTSYTANTTFGSGDEIGTGNFVVYNGTGNSVNITNLEGGTRYYFKIFEYNCAAGSEAYLVGEDVLVANEITALSNVQNLQTDCISENSASLHWDAPLGLYEGVIVTVRHNAVPSDPSCAGSTLTNPITDFSTADIYCGNATSSVYVYNGTGHSVNISGLTAGESYTFKLFTYQNNAWSSGTQITKTINLLPISNQKASVANAESPISWSLPQNCFDEILVVATNNAFTTTPSGDGSAYTADATYGNGTDIGTDEYVVYKGTGQSTTVTNLTNSTEYCFRIWVRYGTQWSTHKEMCVTPLDITIIEPTDLVIMAVNTNNTVYPNEEFTFACFKNIKVGTPIDFTENGYNRDSNYPGRWGTTEGTIRITRNGGGDLPAGTSVTVVMTASNGTTAADFDIFVGGVDDLAAGNWTVQELNPTNGSGFNLNSSDDIWIMQNGSWLEHTPGEHDDEYTGNILYGWTATGWPGADASGSTAYSELYPGMKCFTTDFSGLASNDKVKYTGPFTAATKLEWIARINDEGNWTGYSSDANYEAGGANYRGAGVTLSINPGTATPGVWTGIQNSDWFDCGNWHDLKVPTETENVTVNSTYGTQNVIIDESSPEAVYSNGQASCNDLSVDDFDLSLNASTDKLNVYGNLSIETNGTLDMTNGGNIYISGNWTNNALETAFTEGNGTVHFNGNSQQTISTNAFTENFNNLTIINTSSIGVLLNNSIAVNGAFTHTDGELNLNADNLTISGDYTRTTGNFIGHTSSDFTISGNGTLNNLFFVQDFNLNNFTMNRNARTAVLMTDLLVDNTFTISDGAATMTAGNDYDAGTLVNSVGTSGLLLKSNAAGTASLRVGIDAGNGAVPATVERYFPQDTWHYYLSPLDDVDRTDLSEASWGVENPNFYYYDETIADFWQGLTVYNPTGWTNESAAKLSTDKAYIHQSTETRTYILDGGNLEDSDKSFTLSYTDNGPGNEPYTGTDWEEFEGWNLIGNPYTCALNWDDVWTQIVANGQDGYIENGVYYYDDSQDNYVFYGAGTMNDIGITINGVADDKFIPANQGFFVKATPAGHGKSVTIKKSARTHSSQAFWKNEQVHPNMIRLNIEKDGYTDETVVRTLENATFNHDFSLDAYKMFTWNAAKPQIYSRNEEKTRYFSLNSLPEIEGHQIVPLGLYIGEAGDYQISMTENSFEDMHLWLEDKHTDEMTNLRTVNSWTLNQTAEDNSERYVLHFDKNSPPESNTELPNQAFELNETIYFELPEDAFTDPDFGDTLTYKASSADGNELPNRLVFDPENLSFSGTISELGSYTINIEVTDGFNETAENNFTLEIYDTSGNNDVSKNSVSIYPNPANDELYIRSLNEQITAITIVDISGKLIVQKYLTQKTLKMDVSDLSKGMYFIEIQTKSQIFRKSFIKK